MSSAVESKHSSAISSRVVERYDSVPGSTKIDVCNPHTITTTIPFIVPISSGCHSEADSNGWIKSFATKCLATFGSPGSTSDRSDIMDSNQNFTDFLNTSLRCFASFLPKVVSES